MPDSFDVELARLVRVLRDGSATEAGLECARLLLGRLVAADDAARHTADGPPLLPHEMLSSALLAVAHDASTAGVDLETFAGDVAAARWSCTP